jgi:dipeptidyl-peptidase-4
MTSARSTSLAATLLCGALAAPASALAQQKTLTVEAIYLPRSRADLGLTSAPEYTWLDDRTLLSKPRANEAAREWMKVDAVTGQATTLVAPDPSEDVLALDTAQTAVLVRIADDLHVRDLASGRTTRVTSTPGTEEEPTFSPDGSRVAFVRGNNLHVVEIASQRERAITSDGSDDLLNGKLDWVYQEEIYGRGKFRAYWWSPDSTAVAFLQLNDAPVPDYTVTDHVPYHPALEVSPYPKAGDPNPTVRLAVAAVAGGEPRWIDLTSYGATEILIVDVAWTPDSSRVMYQVQDREQTWLDLNAAGGSGAPVRVLRETTKAWVNNLGSPVWLKDGTFLWLSERTGFKHLYRYKPDGTLVKPLTTGRWDIRTFIGADERTGSAYFTGTERSALGADVYRVALDGSGLRRLSQAEGTHTNVAFNPSFTQYVDVWSTVTTPWQSRVHRADGAEVRIIEANAAPELANYRFAKPEFLQVKARDGVMLDALLIKPPDFDPLRRYAVFQHTYGGPGAQRVINQWDGQRYLFHQLLARQGILVWICDNRSASGKGVESQWPIYGRLGELELRDIEDGVAWLKQQPWVDAARLILEGWSYGGFMTSYALTHSTSFTAGIVGAPVTDWRNYDSVYTERYMKMPQNNPEGYAATSPAKAAGRLHGRMLLLHGLTDDNVHVQNAIHLAYELQKAGTPFEMMVYPRSRHAFADPRLTAHMKQLVLDFVMRTIGPKATPPPTAAAAR